MFVAKTDPMPVYDSYNAFNEQFDGWVSRLSIMYFLQIVSMLIAS